MTDSSEVKVINLKDRSITLNDLLWCLSFVSCSREWQVAGKQMVTLSIFAQRDDIRMRRKNKIIIIVYFLNAFHIVSMHIFTARGPFYGAHS